LAIPAVFAVLGALIVHQRPSNRVGWLMLVAALGSDIPTGVILGLMPPPEKVTLGIWLLATVDNWSWILLIFPIFLIPLHFPSGQPPTPRWRWVNWLALGLALLFIPLISLTTTIGPATQSWELPNPVGFIPLELLNGSFLTFWGIGLITIILGSVGSLFVRYRHAGIVEREQIKWLLYAGAFFAVTYALTFFLTPTDANSDAWGNLALTFAILLLPFAIAIAILRYRLYDIDIIIRKTLQYGVVTGLLALVYFGSIVLLQSLFDAVTGAQSPVVIVISTLLIASLFNPLRHRVQGFIDRRFFRQKYDAQQVLAQFAQTARDEVSLEVLRAELSHVVQETLQPEQVTIWLKRVTR
jgi:hypothetical protein